MTLGVSGARVSRRPGAYRKESNDPAHDLVDEGLRARWLRDQGLPAPEVLVCEPGLLVTSEVPGVPASEEWPATDRPRVTDAVAGLARALHALPVDSCPFDRRLDVVLAGLTTGDRARLGGRPDTDEPVVCHGDLCLPNVLLDPDTFAVTGVVDVGRLGVADRWADLALTVWSLSGPRNPQFGTTDAARFLAAYGVAADPRKAAFYRRLDTLG